MVIRKKKTIEILSPGKNLHYAKEAIKCGADSIYIGASKFSLRHEHGNTFNDIKELVDFAHKYWVKVYVPLNCLLFSENDIKEAQEIINKLYEIGVDALIIQDIGILEFDLPPIPVFLSTNTGCYTKEIAQFYEKCGITRIVLPRELTFDEIKDITENTNIQIETFCYGFLCVGYSGNCYLAYVENLKKNNQPEIAHYNASNHGVCPERCMGNWTLTDACGNIIVENDRLFNLRFLSLHEEIEKLFDIGVDSFKIAGREKDLKHVKNSTAVFSQIANEICKKKKIKRSSSGRCILSFTPELSKNFNKGFTNFFIAGRKKEMYSKKHIVGEFVGNIKNIDGKYFELDSDKKLNIGDKLRYKDKKGFVQVLKVIEVLNDKGYSVDKSFEDIDDYSLYRYINVEGFNEVEKSVNYRVISVNLTILYDCKKYIIYAVDEDGNAIRCEYKKGTQMIATNNLVSYFTKINPDCEFVVDEVNVENDVFVDNIEEFKQIIFDALRKERLKNRPKLGGNIIKNQVPFYKKELSYLDNVTNNMAKSFYNRHGVQNIEMGLETGISLKNKRIFSSRYCLRYELGMCSKNSLENIPVLPWKLTQIENGNKFRVEFDCSKCSMYLYLDDEDNE